jgi:hypothetical protein
LSTRHHSFKLVSTNVPTPERFYHCSTKNEWLRFLKKHYEKKLLWCEIDYEKTLSNAAFRLCGIEIKFGLLLTHNVAVKAEQNGSISGAVLPSIVIDLVLAIYSTLEGLGTLSFIASMPPPAQQTEVDKTSRKRKFPKGIKAATGEDVKKQMEILIKLRDRCIHQDEADRADGKDYEQVFSMAALSEPLRILGLFLKSMEADENEIPSTNLFKEIA